MALSLNYRIEIPLALTRMQIRELRRFYDEGEKHFNFGFNKLKAETVHLTPEEWEKENARLKRLVAELSLEKQVLKDVAEGNF